MRAVEQTGRLPNFDVLSRELMTTGAEFGSKRVPGLILGVHGVGVANTCADDSGMCPGRFRSCPDVVFRGLTVSGAELYSRRVLGLVPWVHGMGVLYAGAGDSGACTDRLPSDLDVVCRGLTAEGAGLVLKRIPSLELDMDGAGVLDADVGASDACAGASCFAVGDVFDASQGLPNRAPRDTINERVVGSSNL